MGMSGDYEEAIKFGATHIRVGSAFLGLEINKVIGFNLFQHVPSARFFVSR